MDPESLTQVLRGLPQMNDPRLLVGSATADDAGVFQIDDERALVQTLDFFTPIVDDPFLFGKIAAANSLSDVYAMGGRPITAMAIAGMPPELDNDIIHEIFRGGAEKAKEAGCVLIGGHTIKNPEPIYGLSVTGMVHPERYMANTHAQPGEVIVLSKPLGTGISSTAIKRGSASQSLIEASIESMTTLNFAGADLAEKGLSRAGTDITGFGLLGHLMELCEGSGVTAEIDHSTFPVLHEDILPMITDGLVPGGTKKNLTSVADRVHFADAVSQEHQLLLADAQTSGGILFTVKEEHLSDAITVLKEHNSLASAIIGRTTEPQEKAIIVQ